MKAGYLIAPGRIEVRETELPAAEPGGIVVRVRAALTDGTDLKAFRRGHPQMPMPTRFGHEFAGDVIAVGAGIEERFAPGEAVMCVHSAPCGRCAWCAHGQEELCEHVMATKILGAYADAIAVPPHIVRRNAFHKPADLPYEAAAFLEPLACVVHSLQLLAVPPGGRVVIVGDGGFGILHALVARHQGARPLLVGRRGERLALAALTYGLETIDARGLAAGPLRDRVAARTDGGRGADAVVECTGSPAVWETALDLVRRGGTVSLFGGLPGGTRVEFDAARLHYDELRLISPFHFSTHAVRAAFELLARDRLDVLPLISRAYPLAELERAFTALDGGAGIKYAIVP